MLSESAPSAIVRVETLGTIIFQQNWMTAKRESDLLIKGTITDRIGRHEVLLVINRKYYTFRGP